MDGDRECTYNLRIDSQTSFDQTWDEFAAPDGLETKKFPSSIHRNAEIEWSLHKESFQAVETLFSEQVRSASEMHEDRRTDE